MRKKTLAEARTAHKEFLVQLFPVVSVTTCDFAGWLDEFEVKVRDILEEKDEEVCMKCNKLLAFFNVCVCVWVGGWVGVGVGSNP